MPAALAEGFEGSEAFIGVFALCIAAGLGLPMLFTEFIIAPFRRKRTFLFWGHVAPALLLLALAAWVSAMAGSDPAFVRVGYLVTVTLFFLAIGFQVPLWLGLVGDLFPHSMRARVLGIAFAFNRSGALAGGFLAEWVLDLSWSPNDQWTLLFAVGGVAMLIGCVPFLFIVEDEREPQKRPRLRQYFGTLRRTWQGLPALRRFVRADALGCTAFVVLMFYGDAAIRAHGVHESWAGVWTRTSSAAQLVLSLLIAAYGDRIAPRTWLIVGGLAAAGASVAAAEANTAALFHIPAALMGMYLVIRMSCNGPEILRLAGSRDGTTPIALAWFFVIPVQGLAPYLSGEFLIPDVGYRPVFLVVACLSLVCTVLWMRDRRAAPGNQDSSGESA